MKKATIVNLVVVVSVLALVSGCSTLGKGPSDEELAMEAATTFSQAVVSKDLEGAMAVVSEDFFNSDAGDKAALGDYIQGAMDAGYFENGKCDVTAAEVTLEGETATVYPIQMSSDMGAITVSLELKKEKGGFMVVDLDAET